jgi:hypothetical protein
MTPQFEPPHLTSDLDYWEVTLEDGGTVAIRAHTVTERNGHYCFMALMVGDPAYEYELVRFPVASVAHYEGGWPAPRA